MTKKQRTWYILRDDERPREFPSDERTDVCHQRRSQLRMRARGLCMGCSEPKEPDRHHRSFCQVCSHKRGRYNSLYRKRQKEKQAP